MSTKRCVGETPETRARLDSEDTRLRLLGKKPQKMIPKHRKKG